jgi:hypothetical protein
VIKFKGGHSEKIPTPTIDKEPENGLNFIPKYWVNIVNTSFFNQ